jgi:hypothetical protein
VYKAQQRLACDRTYRTRRLMSAEAASLLAEYGWVSRAEAVGRYGLPGGYVFDGLLEVFGTAVVAYLLPPRVRPTKVKRVRQEIPHLHLMGFGDAVVFCADVQAARAFGRDPAECRSLYVLPFPSGVPLLKFLDRSVLKSLYAEAFGVSGFHPSGKLFADYMAPDENAYLTNVLANDLVRWHYLKLYLAEQYLLEGRAVWLVCLDEQEELVRREVGGHPGLVVKTFS